MKMDKPHIKGPTAARGYIRVGVAASAVLVLGIGGWMATAKVAGAVVAPGKVVVVSDVKKIQHPSGGVIGSIHIKEGQRVKQGTPLVRLDDTITRANLAVIEKSLDEVLARQARLTSERDAATTIDFHPSLTSRANDPAVSALLESERRLMNIRRIARDGNKASINERIEQLHQEVIGQDAQIEAKFEEIDLVQRELDAARQLWKKKLLPLSRLTALEREATRIKGEKGHLVAAKAQTKGRVAEARLSILQIDRDLMSEVALELRGIDAKIGELRERQVAAQEELQNIELFSPQEGTIHELAIHTIGGVVSAGEVLMQVVPSNERLEIEAKVSPTDIDQLLLGAETLLRLSAFNQRTTPELVGELVRISADTAVDQQSGASYYVVRIAIETSELEKLDGLVLMPGMPVEAFVKTEERLVLSLLIKPFTDQLHRAFREN